MYRSIEKDMYLDFGDHQKALGPSGKTSSKDSFFYDFFFSIPIYCHEINFYLKKSAKFIDENPQGIFTFIKPVSASAVDSTRLSLKHIKLLNDWIVKRSTFSLEKIRGELCKPFIFIRHLVLGSQASYCYYVRFQGFFCQYRKVILINWMAISDEILSLWVSTFLRYCCFYIRSHCPVRKTVFHEFFFVEYIEAYQ